MQIKIMAKTAKSLRYLLIGIIFMSFYQIKPSINRYIVIKSEFEQDTILIVARLSQSDTIIIDTFFNSLYNNFSMKGIGYKLS